MYALKGFIAHAQLATNVPGEVAQIGEISTQSLTYSREKGIYVTEGINDLTFISFLSSQDGTLVAVNNDFSQHVLDVANFVYEGTTTSSNPVFADQLLQDLIERYDETAENFDCGAIIHDDRYYMPEWVSWTVKRFGETDAVENRIKIWFVDASFRDQYDEFQIIIVPPLDNLDDFFRTGQMVEQALKLRTLGETMEKIQAAKGDEPETIVRAETYDYVDPLNAAHKVPSHWGILIYGAAGENVDSIKDALIDHILNNSTHTRAEWTPILPDIFRRTEFLVVPRWQHYAIAPRSVEAGIFSPVTNMKEAIAFLQALIPTYTPLHVGNYATVMVHPWKSISLLMIGSQENRNDWFEITDVFPDLISVSSQSIDFNRMAQATKDWMLMLGEMLLVAENIGEFTDIPLGMTRTHRDGKLYLVKNFQNVHYLVAGKSNWPEVTPDAPDDGGV